MARMAMCNGWAALRLAQVRWVNSTSAIRLDYLSTDYARSRIDRSIFFIEFCKSREGKAKYWKLTIIRHAVRVEHHRSWIAAKLLAVMMTASIISRAGPVSAIIPAGRWLDDWTTTHHT